MTPARLGIVYPAASTRRLVALAGPGTAKYLLFSAELIDEERALRTGLIDEVLSDGDELDARVRRFAEVLTSRSRLTQAAAKEFAAGEPSAERVAYWARQAAESSEATEGAEAFLAGGWASVTPRPAP